MQLDFQHSAALTRSFVQEPGVIHVITWTRGNKIGARGAVKSRFGRQVSPALHTDAALIGHGLYSL